MVSSQDKLQVLCPVLHINGGFCELVGWFCSIELPSQHLFLSFCVRLPQKNEKENELTDERHGRFTFNFRSRILLP